MMDDKDILDELNSQSAASKQSQSEAGDDTSTNPQEKSGAVDTEEKTASKPARSGKPVKRILTFAIIAVVASFGGYIGFSYVASQAQFSAASIDPSALLEAKFDAKLTKFQAQVQQSVAHYAEEGRITKERIDNLELLLGEIKETSDSLGLLVDSAFKRNGSLEKKLAQVDSKYDKLMSALLAKVDDVEGQVSGVTEKLAALKQQKVLAVTSANARQRLPEFSVLSPIPGAEGVFSVRAPDRKDGTAHYITLYKGEHFKSKQGRHTVTGYELGEEGEILLEVDEDWYIDNQYGSYSAEQLAKLASTPKATKKSPKPVQRHTVQTVQTSKEHIGKSPTEPQAMAAAPTSQVKPSEADEVANVAKSATSNAAGQQYRDGKILLRDWRIIVTRPDENRVVVVNTNQPSGSVQEMKMNGYYGFFGTVRSIDYQNGVCSDSYCIVE